MTQTKNGSIWHGNKTDGVELRYKDGDLDEILLYVAGVCVFVTERMDDTFYWMGFYAKDHTVHANLASKNGRSHVAFQGEDGWENEAEAPK